MTIFKTPLRVCNFFATPESMVDLENRIEMLEGSERIAASMHAAMAINLCAVAVDEAIEEQQDDLRVTLNEAVADDLEQGVTWENAEAKCLFSQTYPAIADWINNFLGEDN